MDYTETYHAQRRPHPQIYISSQGKTTIEYVYGGTAHPVTRQGIGLGNIERMMGTAMPNALLPPIGLLLGAERGACLRDRDKTRERGPSNALHVV